MLTLRHAEPGPVLDRRPPHPPVRHVL